MLCTISRQCSIAIARNAGSSSAPYACCSGMPSGAIEFEADQMFGSVEQRLFTQALSLAEKHGKTIHLAVVASNEIWDGILRAAANLQSSTIVLGTSAKYTLPEQARQIGLAWERLCRTRGLVSIWRFSRPAGSANSFCSGRMRPT